MKQIQAAAAKARFSELLDEVEGGETIVITRHGRAIARISPENARRQEEIEDSIAAIKELRKKVGRASLEEILAWRAEGRR